MKALAPLLFFLITVQFLPFHLDAQSEGENIIREFEMQKGDTTLILKQYFLGILLQGEAKDALSEEESALLQKRHLAYMDSLKGVGFLKIAGPFGDATEKRGIVIYDVATLEEAQSLAAGDPAVKAGRLKLELHPWWAAKGSVLD